MGVSRLRKIALGLLGLFVSTSLVNVGTDVHVAHGQGVGGVFSSSTDEVEPNPLDVIWGKMGSVPSQYDGYGAYFDATTRSLYSGISYSPRSQTNDDSVYDWSLCSEVNSSSCQPTGDKSLLTDSLLGVCRSATELGCIEEVLILGENSTMTPMTLVGYIGDEDVFAEYVPLSVPRGSAVSRWQSSDGSQFIVTAHVKRQFTSAGGNWANSSTWFQLQVQRVTPSVAITPNRPEVQANPEYPGKNRIIVPVGTVPAIKFRDQTAFSIKVRLPDVVRGWFQARFKDGIVGSTQLTNERTVYEFTGTVAPVIIAGAAVPSSILPPDFVEKNYGRSFSRGVTLPTEPGLGTNSLRLYEAWAPYFGENAMLTSYQWNVRSTDWAISNQCFSSLKGVSGLLATNAAAYVGLPPTWDAATGSLDYKVAAPHFDENGQVNVGNYTLSFPLAAANCLYGSTNLPPTVDVTVGPEGLDPNFAAKLGLSESNGWLNFSVKGFHYSSPTIKVKLGKASLGSGANGLLTVKVNKKLTARSIAKFAGLSVKSTSKVKLVVSKASRTRCAIQGATLVAKATGRCTVTITVTPKRGKPVKKTVSVTVTGPPTITRSITASAKAIADYVKLEVPTSSKISLKVAKASLKNCRVSGSKIKGLQKGSCRVTVNVSSVSGASETKTVNLKVT